MGELAWGFKLKGNARAALLGKVIFKHEKLSRNSVVCASAEAGKGYCLSHSQEVQVDKGSMFYHPGMGEGLYL